MISNYVSYVIYVKLYNYMLNPIQAQLIVHLIYFVIVIYYQMRITIRSCKILICVFWGVYYSLFFLVFCVQLINYCFSIVCLTYHLSKISDIQSVFTIIQSVFTIFYVCNWFHCCNYVNNNQYIIVLKLYDQYSNYAFDMHYKKTLQNWE